LEAAPRLWPIAERLMWWRLCRPHKVRNAGDVSASWLCIAAVLDAGDGIGEVTPEYIDIWKLHHDRQRFIRRVA
jgi:hypothetical protein